MRELNASFERMISPNDMEISSPTTTNFKIEATTTPFNEKQ